jgi:uncharacterized membrane protein YcaP (DUF421 family)
MFEELWQAINSALGLDQTGEHLNWLQMTLRAVVIYIISLAYVRMGEKRFIGRFAAFDVILGIIFGSVMSRAINGSADFVSTLAAGLALMALHSLVAAIGFRSHWFSDLTKGKSYPLVKDGEIQRDGMRDAHLTERELEEQLRLQAKLTDVSEVKEAYFERSGHISVIPRKGEPQVLEVAVADGVQTVRLKLE